MNTEEIIDKRKKNLKKDITLISLIILCFLVFRSVLFEPYRIPSGSMLPTLKIGDFILVKKYSYGFKLPFSDLAIFEMNLDPIYLFGKKNPDRGDVVVFKYPRDTSINYIKRVVGVPGDTLEIKDKIVYINDKAIEIEEINGKPFLKDMDARYKGNNLKFYKTKVDEHSFVIQQDVDNIYTSQLDKMTIPKGKFFVMGDNRDFSSDSRFWGFVPHEYIRGEAILVWFSISMPGQSNGPQIRAERILKSID
jgi:signal peptidase I